jgi:hypothetical protein
MADEVEAGICTLLQNIIGEIPPQGFLRKTLSLSFTYEGIPYTTIFKFAGYTTQEAMFKGIAQPKNYEISNKCITISKGFAFTGSIAANKPKKDDPVDGICFSPMLVSKRTPEGKITSIDVLQTLKTKLCVLLKRCIPLDKDRLILVSDKAIKNNIRISSFLLLRGEDAIYEKYGYTARNPLFNQFKEFIRTLRWAEYIGINPELKPYYAKLYTPEGGESPVELDEYVKVEVDGYTTPLQMLIASKYPEGIPQPTKFIDVMKGISWEDVVQLSEYGEVNDRGMKLPIPYIMENKSNEVTFTDGILETLKGFFIAQLKPEGNAGNAAMHSVNRLSLGFMESFQLNEYGRWATYDSKLRFTNLTVVAPQGGRRRTKGRRRKSSRRTRHR